MASTQYAENLFLIRWLLERGRKHGPAGKLRQHLEYLWRSCSGNLAEQSDLFRLRYATETLKDRGWDNYVMDNREWKSGVMPIPSQKNGFYVEKTALNAAFMQDGSHLLPLHFRIVGDAAAFITVMAEYGLQAKLIDSTPAHHLVAQEPA